jgi:hypothetical protein
MWLLFQLDGILFGFLLLSSSSVFQSAAVPGGRNSISPPSPSPVRKMLKKHPTHIQTIMTLPTLPHAIFSTLQGTQNPDTRPTLQRAKKPKTQPTHSRLT